MEEIDCLLCMRRMASAKRGATESWGEEDNNNKKFNQKDIYKISKINEIK